MAQPITIAVSDDGNLYWNDQPITKDQIESRLSVEAQKTPQPADQRARRQDDQVPRRPEVVQVAQNQGMRKVGFVADQRTALSL